MVPIPPPPPPRVLANPQLFRNPFKATSEILNAAKAALKAVVPRVKEGAPTAAAATTNVDDGNEHSYALANPPSPAMEVSVDDAQNASMQGNTSCGDPQFSQPKKAKLSADFEISDPFISSSPDLHHKLPSREHQFQDDENSEDSDLSRVHTNLHGVNFVMWFEIGIEGKSPMDEEEEDWGGKLEFGFSDSSFPKDIEDYFLIFEDECTQSHACAGRVMGVLSHFRGKVLEPPSYDPRNIVDLIEKYGDAHISDSGWREVDPEEWFSDN